jgi:tetratricopeptide (TPR) repeat protein
VIASAFQPVVYCVLATCLLLAGTAPVYSQAARRPTATRPSKGQPKLTPRNEAAFKDLVKRADEARATGRLEEAGPLYTQALKLKPTWAEGWWYVGTILYEKDFYADAREAFRNLAALDSKNGAAWGMLGLCEFQTREYPRAIISLQRGRLLGLSGNPELTTVVRYHTALLYIRIEQFELAFDILREFLREGNEAPKIVEAFGLTMLRLPLLPTDVPADKREAVQIAGRAGFNLAARRLDLARAAYDELLARYPEMPSVHYAYGIYLLNQDADAALAEFRRELELSPNHVAAMLQIAFEHLKRKEYEAGLPWAEKAVQLAPKLFPARNALGRLLLELGQNERAVKELEEGIKLAPESPEMHYALARAYTRVGRKADAAREREEFQRLEKLFRAQREGAQTGNEDKPKS